ncbi:MAG: DNA topoisomerase IB [Alphaproteobacteria bacterium]
MTEPTPAAPAACPPELHYVSDDDPGFSRRRRGRGFSYHDTSGRLIRSDARRRKLDQLAIPPAWKDVWISPSANGHILATGRDQRGRKQYIYHPAWIEERERAKFDRVLAFGRVLQDIREAVDRDLRRRTLVKPRVVATVVNLLETTLIRVGNEEYARSNRSYGLTTLKNRHVDIDGDRLRFHFKGKSGREVDLDLRDRRLAHTVRDIQELPGQQIFQYLDDDGSRQTVTSNDVNDYLRAVTGDDFTAKDFRTWAATVLAAWALNEFAEFDSDVAAKRNITRAIKTVARKLGNTPTVCRESYVHPEVLNAYLDGTLVQVLRDRIEQELITELPRLQPEEAAVLAFLRKRLSGIDTG